MARGCYCLQGICLSIEYGRAFACFACDHVLCARHLVCIASRLNALQKKWNIEAVSSYWDLLVYFVCEKSTQKIYWKSLLIKERFGCTTVQLASVWWHSEWWYCVSVGKCLHFSKYLVNKTCKLDGKVFTHLFLLNDAYLTSTATVWCVKVTVKFLKMLLFTWRKINCAQDI